QHHAVAIGGRVRSSFKSAVKLLGRALNQTLALNCFSYQSIGGGEIQLLNSIVVFKSRTLPAIHGAALDDKKGCAAGESGRSLQEMPEDLRLGDGILNGGHRRIQQLRWGAAGGGNQSQFHFLGRPPDDLLPQP